METFHFLEGVCKSVRFLSIPGCFEVLPASWHVLLQGALLRHGECRRINVMYMTE